MRYLSYNHVRMLFCVRQSPGEVDRVLIHFGAPMNKFLLSVSVIALCALSSTVSAADLLVEVAEPSYEAPSASWGTIEIGAFARYAAEYDEGDLDDEDTVGGAYGSFAAWTVMDKINLGIDGYGEFAVLDGVSDDTSLTPAGLAVLGAHVGTTFDDTYLGVFGAIAGYPNNDNDEAVFGASAGVEASVMVGDALLFGKLGYAFAPSIEYGDEDGDYVEREGMVGPFAEIGAAFSLSDDLAVMVSAGYGYSSDFDVTDNPGGYATWGAKAVYALPTDFALNLTAAYEGYYAYTEEDEDETIEHTVKLGLAIPFGSESPMTSLNPLATSVAPFRAGYSSDAL